MSTLTFRNKPGELVAMPSIASTDVENASGAVLERVAGGGPVAITRHHAPRAALLSFEEFRSLARSRLDALDALDAGFDGLLDRMQTKRSGQGTAAAFEAAPAVLGRAAVKAAGAPKSTTRAAPRIPRRVR